LHRSISIFVIAFCVAGLAACDRRPAGPAGESAPPALQRYWTLPPFSLTERSGKEITLADFTGKIWVADFFYSTCPGPCPMLSSRLSEVQKALGNAPDVRLASISTDPEKDTPEVLNAYAERFKAGPNWFFLTGKKADIFSLARDGFKLPIADAAGAEPIIHTTRLVLIDRTGTVRGFFDGSAEGSVHDLVRDIGTLLKEK
jgi:protein SCO1/2